MEMFGREYECGLLRKAYTSDTSEFVIVYGRRRVGKTFLVRQMFDDKFDFYVTGLPNANKQQQLVNFHTEILKRSEDVSAIEARAWEADDKMPKNWFAMFEKFQSLLEHSQSKKKVVFLDETPWMDTKKSEFKIALEHFWNAWASARNDILLIVCGSAAAWMVKNIVNNHGGLHNRLTYSIHLDPFTLAETKQYLKSRQVMWSDNMIAECYMALGGIPFYLKCIDPQYSLAQNLNMIFFAKNALLKNEFRNLFHSLFKNAEEYIKIIGVLSKKKSGYTRDEIAKKAKMSNGGGLTRMLDTLELSNFIRKYKAVGDVAYIYQLTDFFCLFYFSFIKDMEYDDDEQGWMHIVGKPVYNTWLGLSFEKLCMAHSKQIKKALGISGVATKTYSYHSKSSQIDMVIERDDNMINLCEIKYSTKPYTLSKAEADKIQRRLDEAQEKFGKGKSIQVTLIAAAGLNQNEHSINLVQNVITLSELY